MIVFVSSKEVYENKTTVSEPKEISIFFYYPKKKKMFFRTLSALFFLASPVTSFVVARGGVSTPSAATTNLSASATATEEDVTKPSYDIEPISIRIGHGFDIHKMAPLEEAGQPVVIGGVEIPHKDQKVSERLFKKKEKKHHLSFNYLHFKSYWTKVHVLTLRVHAFLLK